MKPQEQHAPSPRLALISCAALIAIAASGCRRELASEPEPRQAVAPGTTLKPEDVLLVVDDITIRWSDVKPQVDWLDQLAPEYSLRKKIEKALPTHTIPLLFARREFAELRQRQLELARTVRAACGNALELAANTDGRPFRRERVGVGDLESPVAAFLFQPSHVGSVSDPIEVPSGWILAGCLDLQQSRVAEEDTCECIQVGFPTHPSAFWHDWHAALRARIADRVTFVHPEFRLAMPPWLKLP